MGQIGWLNDPTEIATQQTKNQQKTSLNIEDEVEQVDSRET